MVKTELRRWTTPSKPLCFSCGKPTKNATKTGYGIIPFCMNCGSLKHQNEEMNHRFYGKKFFMEIDNLKKDKVLKDKLVTKEPPITPIPYFPFNLVYIARNAYRRGMQKITMKQECRVRI